MNLDLDFFSTDSIVDKAIELGLDRIRCSLSGKVIAHLDRGAIDSAVRFEQFQNPLASDENIIDSLETRWLIQSSRPAPHLTAAKSPDGFRFLREYYPADLFAILASRLVFENLVAEKQLHSIELLRRKMAWLVELQDWLESSEASSDEMLKVLESMIRLDAIVNIRHALYSVEVRDLAADMYNSEFNFMTLAGFVDMVENSMFLALTRMKNAPTGNRMALSAALAAAGATPEQIVAEEEKEVREAEMNRNRIASISARNAGRNGKVKVNRGVKAVVSLSEVVDSLPPALAAKYAADLEKRKASASKAKVDPKTGEKRTRASINAAARFGVADFDF